MTPDPLKEDFRNFLFVVWKFLGLPEPTKRQYAIAHFLQHSKKKRRVIQAFRGIGKSWITAAYVVWLLYCDPSLNIVVVSAGKERSDSFTRFALRLIDGCPLLTHLRPRPEMGQRRSAVNFDVGPAGLSQTASVISLGITSQLTGNRADEVIADDVEIPSNSATVLQREKLVNLVKEFEALLKPTKNAKITFLGTPQTHDSLYKSLNKSEYETRIWPALYPNEDEQEWFADLLAEDVREELSPETVGKSTEPSRFSDDNLHERRISYGAAGFALQFQLDTRDSDKNRYPLRLRDLIVAPLDKVYGPERLRWSGFDGDVIADLPCEGMTGDRLYAPANYLQNTPKSFTDYQGIVMSVDPAGRGKDETGWAVVAHLAGMLYLLDAGGFKGYEEPTLEKIARKAKEFKVNAILTEENMGGGMFRNLLLPVVHRVYAEDPAVRQVCGILDIHSKGQKEARIIDTVEPVVSSHRLVVKRELFLTDFQSTSGLHLENAHHYHLWYQFTRITRDRGSLPYDDRIDALAMAIGYWVDVMAKDVEKAHVQEKEKLMDKEIEDFLSHAIGTTSKPQGWRKRV